MTNPNIALGRWGEQLALNFLTRNGDVLLGRNVRTSYGEIDLITRRGEAIVFIEVKTRASQEFGPPEASVNGRKQQHLIASANQYLQKYPEFRGDWQIDVIAIRKFTDRPPEIVHFKNAVQG